MFVFLRVISVLFRSNIHLDVVSLQIIEIGRPAWFQVLIPWFVQVQLLCKRHFKNQKYISRNHKNFNSSYYEKKNEQVKSYQWNSNGPNLPFWICGCWGPPCRRKERTACGWGTCDAPRRCRRPRCGCYPGPALASRPSADLRLKDGRPIGYRRTLLPSWRSITIKTETKQNKT